MEDQDIKQDTKQKQDIQIDQEEQEEWETDEEGSQQQQQQVENEDDEDWEDVDSQDDKKDKEQDKKQEKQQLEEKPSSQKESSKRKNSETSNKQDNNNNYHRSERKKSKDSSTRDRSHDRKKRRRRDSRDRERRRSRSRSKTRSRVDRGGRDDNHCCSKCLGHGRANRKTCVCVVPRTQRKTQLGDSGCRDCGCKGCSSEDFQQKDDLRNGCCKQCLKAFSENGKACMCQVPNKDRKQQLPYNGCIRCGCHGCHPLDTRLKDKRHKSRSPSPDFGNLNNLNNSQIGMLISDQLQVFPPLIGFGIPQRTYSYLLGKPEKTRY